MFCVLYVQVDDTDNLERLLSIMNMAVSFQVHQLIQLFC
jgi:hypothetical protein